MQQPWASKLQSKLLGYAEVDTRINEDITRDVKLTMRFVSHSLWSNCRDPFKSVDSCDWSICFCKPSNDIIFVYGERNKRWYTNLRVINWKLSLMMKRITRESHWNKQLAFHHTSNVYLEDPTLVLCFSQNFSGLMMKTICTRSGQTSCK